MTEQIDELHIIKKLISSDKQRIGMLRQVAALNLPDWLIAAGFVRNLIWDYLYATLTPLTDVDVVYYCGADISVERDKHFERRLKAMAPDIPWSVKNQARMHIKNGNCAYQNMLDAMSYWPEKQTAIGVRLDANEQLLIQHIFALECLFDGTISRNPKADAKVYKDRIVQKNWLANWPQLTVRYLASKP